MSLPLFKPLLLVLLAALLSAAASPVLRLPTDNTALFDQEPERFYMYTYRTFEGESSRPWEAGQYGFVRTQRRTEGEGVIFTQFHEGIDIRPVKRDAAGRPLDEVCAVLPGVVAYVNSAAGRSNYGIYVVVRHDLKGGPFFSLYAHLASVDVAPDEKVAAGQKLGRMGYTGAGINRERAHLHLEFGIQLSTRFDEWYTGQNHHGLHHGRNLVGLDITTLLLAQKKDPSTTIEEVIARTPVYYKVTIPRRGIPELAERYPWLQKGDYRRPSPSWEIAFSASGFPVSIAPSQRAVTQPLVTFVRTTRSRHEYHTSRRLSGTGRRATLSNSGLSYVELVAGSFGEPS